MHSIVNLDEKQYKKIYKIYLKEEEAREAAFDFPMGPPPGMGFPGEFGEPQKPSVGGKEIDSDEYIDAREAKFKKILTDEQYSTLRRVHPDPAGHFNNQRR